MQSNPSYQPASLASRIKQYRKENRRLDKLEKSLETVTAYGTTSARKWRNRAGSLLLALLAVSGIALAASTATTNNFSGAKADVFAYDETTFTIVSKGMDVSAGALDAAGNTLGAPIEVGVTLGAANTALSAGDWYYAIDVKEASVAVLVSGTYKVELFLDGASKGSLYLMQVSADASAVEGITMKWSLGAVLPANAAYVVKVLPA